jgi:hypothetical protein
MNYQVQPDPYYGIELRQGESADDYIAKARGFSSTAEFREYRDASPARREEMRNARDRRNADTNDDGRKRYVELLKARNNE